jgi:hypothetical protein
MDKIISGYPYSSDIAVGIRCNLWDFCCSNLSFGFFRSKIGDFSETFFKKSHNIRDVRISDDPCFRYAPAKIIAILHMQFP